jgi:hypothetical protein
MRCSTLSSELGEPLVGTAPHVERWHLVVHGGPWRRQAVEDAGVVAPAGTKALLVRHAVPEGRAFLVCRNGARDQCCALYGADVSRALGDRAVDCTHVGGHRFAANVLVVPDNLMFGLLRAGSAVALAAELEAGRLPLEHLRGRCSLTPEQQAAEILLRRELGIETLDGLRHVAGTTFALADGRRVTAELASEALPPRRVSCRDDKLESPTRWLMTGYDRSD